MTNDKNTPDKNTPEQSAPAHKSSASANPPRMFINGEATEVVAAADRGLAYGDGLFETIAVANRRPEFWDRHMERLGRGCRILKLPPPDPDRLAEQAADLCRALPAGGDKSRAIIKIIVTRGVGGRGYTPPPQPAPTVIVSRHDWPNYPAERAGRGVVVRLCDLRLARQPALAGIKHLNRLENVLARAEWDDPDIAEGLLRDQKDRLIEGVMSNLFLVCDGGLATPDLRDCGVAGIMRGVVLDLAGDLGLNTVIRDIAESELQEAGEVFLTNSAIGIWPVRSVIGRTLSPGPMTRRLQAALTEKRAAETAGNEAKD